MWITHPQGERDRISRGGPNKTNIHILCPTLFFSKDFLSIFKKKLL